jgi:methyltransferase-like protein 6
VLKRGSGRVLFRDYAEGDLAQERLQDSKGVRHIRGNFYARGDGTCCYYFGQVGTCVLCVQL